MHPQGGHHQPQPFLDNDTGEVTKRQIYPVVPTIQSCLCCIISLVYELCLRQSSNEYFFHLRFCRFAVSTIPLTLASQRALPQLGQQHFMLGNYAICKRDTLHAIGCTRAFVHGEHETNNVLLLYSSVGVHSGHEW
jgi:hypothetical protein